MIEGTVVAASSPLASDSLARIALTSHLVSSSQVSEITRKLASSPERDEIEVLAEAARLGEEHVEPLRKRVITQRAARSFSIERGEYVIDDEITLPIEPPCEIDLRAVIYLGIRMNLSEQRLASDLREIGSSYLLRPGALDKVDRYGFGNSEQPILAALAEGTSLAELEATQREIEPRTMQAVVYALCATGACDATGGKPVERPAEPPVPRTATRLGHAGSIREIQVTDPDEARDMPAVSRTATPVPQTPARQPRAVTAPGVSETSLNPPTQRGPAVARTPDVDESGSSAMQLGPAGGATPSASRTATQPVRTIAPEPASAGSDPEPPSFAAGSDPEAPRPPPTSQRLPVTPRAATVHGTGPSVPRVPTAPALPRTTTARRLAAREIESLIVPRLEMLGAGADHFAMLGLIFEAPIDAVRAAYFNLARQLHPDKISDLAQDPTSRSCSACSRRSTSRS
jgi:hypothetical protein